MFDPDDDDSADRWERVLEALELQHDDEAHSDFLRQLRRLLVEHGLLTQEEGDDDGGIALDEAARASAGAGMSHTGGRRRGFRRWLDGLTPGCGFSLDDEASKEHFEHLAGLVGGPERARLLVRKLTGGGVGLSHGEPGGGLSAERAAAIVDAQLKGYPPEWRRRAR
jgi:hypothetical protein